MTPHGGGYAAAGHLRAAPRLRAVPPASTVAAAIAARRAHGPPLTPEPLRPLTESGTGGRTALPARRAALDPPDQDQIPTTQSLQFQGIARHEVAHSE